MTIRAPHFSPHVLAVGARESGCLTCAFNHGQLAGSHVVCERFERPSVIGAAQLGCAYWQREPGSDDE